MPKRVDICDVGPRDGFQFEEKLIPTDVKLEAIASLVDAGLKRIQVTSFVHPKRVPQMADAEELASRLEFLDDVIYSGLVLNRRGLERALGTSLQQIDLSIATNETHSADNVNMTVDQGFTEARGMLSSIREAGRSAQFGLQTVFGYASPGDTPLGRVAEMVQAGVDLGAASISLADTTGMANPRLVHDTIYQIGAITGDIPIVLHLHDTRGLGMANVAAALDAGVRWFDTSFGGLGGCPFITGATGNIATEDTVYLVESLGYEAGIDLEKVARVTLRMEAFLKRKLPGRIHGLVGSGAPVTMPVEAE